ncbi:superoxide dismutase family protein [Halobacillus litoralis]|uniref:Superoxide dismutase family protein n=1 Tax=Halobacillus litoralis TaxID=45668 RepID=A0A845DPA9_9BACI|nr:MULTISPECIES: superoxide dismutase family protein [Halobacillus]MYL19340.1 superoxide dismutase family protein [Halobacillus litoralis]MYL28484.1 superoxide dismutase family protein [Halobacillus halophilus]MYL38084.1 superoxide dismutase family protein [Halobacillus litoralis]
MSYYHPNPGIYRQPFASRTAAAEFSSSPAAPGLKGNVQFYQMPYGVEVFVYVEGLPPFKKEKNGVQTGPHGFHIHEKGLCEIGDGKDPFATAGGHWNPDQQPHGNHAGDFPVLFSNQGRARMIFFTDRFKVDDIIGRSVIIHQGPDDYKSQPTGRSGKRIACAVIQSG